jgi:hypothetical protein
MTLFTTRVGPMFSPMFILMVNPMFSSMFRLMVWKMVRNLFALGFSILFSLLCSVGWMEGAIAQSSSPQDVRDVEQTMPPPARLDANTISSEKLSQFTQAYLKVVDLIERREGELQAAETELESERMQTEIEAAALKEIEAVGLTLQEYLQLLGFANIDAEFGERVTAQLQEMGD